MGCVTPWALRTRVSRARSSCTRKRSDAFLRPPDSQYEAVPRQCGRGIAPLVPVSLPHMDERIAGHISASSTRTDADADRLADRLLGESWPGGPSDRSERGALGWLRHW